MDSGLSTVRNLLYIVLVLALLSLGANIYVGTQLAAHSEELARLGLVLQKQLMTTGVKEADELKTKMDQLNKDADAIDAKMQKSQADFEARGREETRKILDNYVATRATKIERLILTANAK